jgi:hypothetical protein
MTSWLGRRSDVRVDYREPVRVIWPGEVSGVRAQAVNLSRAGILVDAPTPAPVDVGADVLCDVALPRRGSVLLRGRIAHRRLLSPAKVGMGIEFVDLSPDEAAELRDLVDAGDEKPARVLVRFDGTGQTVRARAVATDDGFRLTTALPFAKLGASLEMSLAAEALPRAAGRVADVALDVTHADGIPRLLIDVRVDAVGAASWDVPTPVVETRVPSEAIERRLASLDDAVPEEINDQRVWEPDELAAVEEDARPTESLAAQAAAAQLAAAEVLTPDDDDRTQVVELPARSRRGWAIATGMVIGAIGVVAFGPAVLRRAAPPVVEPSPSLAPPAIATQPKASVPEPTPPEPVAPPPAVVASPKHFTVGLTGSLAGANRYLLRAPDGVAYNVPRARPKLAMGTYEADLPGVRAVWVRPLAGGGTNVRVFFKAGAPEPRVALDADGVTVTAAP